MEHNYESLSGDEHLNHLVGDYYKQLGKGCAPAFRDFASGKAKRRAREIAQITGIDDSKDVMDLLSGVTLMAGSSLNKEEAANKIHESFMKGTDGGQRTGIASFDNKVESAIVLSKIALDKYWEQREQRRSQSATQ